ncbi:hypothetical protein D0Z07_3460 [Hyphodiscus hymeniophilus]|uniref:2EXR domain-containing protein n=1 Tax=Hyphodiscus hymeniophilus TaxID=353542 RepID=A0A9P6VM85_9HELO|nr:hypothetical protein D0Z07_3460 [Hyphodiscus hymeniophilus]
MTLQLPYNPNNGAAGPPAPIPFHGPILFARVSWTAICPPASLFSCPISRPRIQTFHQFPLLPPELRLRIWSFALPRRVIELRSWGTGQYCPTKFSVTPHRLPVLFRTCRESRTEALRLYKLVKVGVSAAQRIDMREYVQWEHHPTNPQSNSDLTLDTVPLPYAVPHPPAEVYLNWENDVLYLGLEFHAHHLHDFLKGSGDGHELSGVQLIALSHNLWRGSRNGRWDELRAALYSLKTRPVKEVIIVPDDAVGALEDRWYYRRHEIKLLDPEYIYHFKPGGGEEAKTVVENLQEWFGRLWADNQTQLNGEHGAKIDDNEGVNVTIDEGVEVVRTVIAEYVPRVCVKSIRRNGQAMANFRNGLWGIQEAVGDMRYWKTWTQTEMEEIP